MHTKEQLKQDVMILLNGMLPGWQEITCHLCHASGMKHLEKVIDENIEQGTKLDNQVAETVANLVVEHLTVYAPAKWAESIQAFQTDVENILNCGAYEGWEEKTIADWTGQQRLQIFVLEYRRLAIEGQVDFGNREHWKDNVDNAVEYVFNGEGFFIAVDLF